MPTDIAANASGVCSTPGCSGTSLGKRSIRDRRSSSNTTAEQTCDTFINNYLNRLSRQPHQRDIHYNGTITSARQMCVFDVTANDETVSLFHYFSMP